MALASKYPAINGPKSGPERGPDNVAARTVYYGGEQPPTPVEMRDDDQITVTRSELADLVASAAAAAVSAHAAGASPTTMRAAALRAVE